jgi:cytochrome c
MKKLLVLSTALFIISCGSDTSNKQGANAPARVDVKDPEAEKGLDLITKSDCFTCHKLTGASSGPPYSAIAAKYKVINDITMDSMVTQIIKGGSGRWGFAKMTPHPQISMPDAKTMVHYIMSIKE